MRKFFFLGLMTFAAVSLTAEIKVATFENEAGGIQLSTEKTYWLGIEPLVDGANNWKSGDFSFATYKDVSEYGTYYYAFYASNQKENTSTGWTEPYRSASGGAYEGDNFGVWYQDWNGNNSIKFDETEIPGFFVNNNAYTVNSMVNVEGEQFVDTNYLKLTCTGMKAGVVVKSIDVDLASKGEYIDKWTYVDLSTLGSIDEVVFSMEGNKKNDYGLVTPTYICLDNFGAAKPDPYVEPERAKFPVLPSAIESIVSSVCFTKFR